MKKIIKIIAPGSLNKVTNAIVQKFRGILILIKDPNKLITKINKSAINSDLKNHLIKFFIHSSPHIIIWDNTSLYY